MKQLTIISIVLMIPTLVSSIFGMNVPNYLENSNWAFPVIVTGSVSLAIIGVISFRKRQWF
jgi:magnesium transporter